MKTLSEHNKEVKKKWEAPEIPAGVVCDLCGTQLLRELGGVFIATFPGEFVVKVRCPNCGYRGEMET